MFVCTGTQDVRYLMGESESSTFLRAVSNMFEPSFCAVVVVSGRYPQIRFHTMQQAVVPYGNCHRLHLEFTDTACSQQVLSLSVNHVSTLVDLQLQHPVTRTRAFDRCDTSDQRRYSYSVSKL